MLGRHIGEEGAGLLGEGLGGGEALGNLGLQRRGPCLRERAAVRCAVALCLRGGGFAGGIARGDRHRAGRDGGESGARSAAAGRHGGGRGGADGADAGRHAGHGLAVGAGVDVLVAAVLIAAVEAGAQIGAEGDAEAGLIIGIFLAVGEVAGGQRARRQAVERRIGGGTDHRAGEVGVARDVDIVTAAAGNDARLRGDAFVIVVGIAEPGVDAARDHAGLRDGHADADILVRRLEGGCVLRRCDVDRFGGDVHRVAADDSAVHGESAAAVDGRSVSRAQRCGGVGRGRAR